MPSTSRKQHNFMAAIAHSPEFAKKAGVPQSVGKDFTAADKGRTFKEGGSMSQAPRGPNPGPRQLQRIAAQQQPQRRPMMVSPQGVPMGAPGMKKGGAVDGIARRGKTKGKVC